MTARIVDELTIQNFKSIKQLNLKPKRINLFVGRPNAGKSNILEALGLFSVLPSGDLKEFVRFEKLQHLFYNQNVKSEIRIEASRYYSLTISYVPNKFKLDYCVPTNPQSPFDAIEEWSRGGTTNLRTWEINEASPSFHCILSPEIETPFKKYRFQKPLQHRANRTLNALQVPFGDNIFYMLETHPELFEEAAKHFAQYGLDLVLNQENETMLTQKKIGHRVFQLPYSLVADTLQRIIFYLAAIKTNSESVLIFEEPETHSFPPYVAELAMTIAEAKNNQFFIATHSPYLFNTIIEETPKEEVAVFVVDYENHQTVARPVSEADYGEIIDYGIDIFFNLRRAMKKDVGAT